MKPPVEVESVIWGKYSWPLCGPNSCGNDDNEQTDVLAKREASKALTTPESFCGVGTDIWKSEIKTGQGDRIVIII